MKRFFQILVFLGFFLCAKEVQAVVFYPDSTVFQDQRDGIWEFPEKKTWAEPVGVEREKLMEFSFEEGMPAEIHASGQVRAVEGVLRLNASENPQFLVRNKVEWVFSLERPERIWLEIEYRVWSEETEVGFDDPVFLVYYNENVVHTEGVFHSCGVSQRLGSICSTQKRRWYLGESQAANAFTLFAGEMGDAEKVSGVEIDTIVIWKAQEKDRKEPLSEEPEFLSPSHSQSAKTAEVHSFEKVIERVTERYEEEPRIARASEKTNGEVLGSMNVSQPTDQEIRQQETEERDFFPWVVMGASLFCIGTGIIFWRKGAKM